MQLMKITTLTVLISVLFFAGCSSISEKSTSKKSEDTIKIGVYEPLTGVDSFGGNRELEGIILANEIMPTVLGKKVELIVVDHKSNRSEAAKAVSKMIEENHLSAIIGSWGSSYSIAAGPVIQEAHIPTIGVTCSSPLVTYGSDYYFRVCFTDQLQGAAMAAYAHDTLKIRKVAILQEYSNDYSIGLAKAFSDFFIQQTGDSNAVVYVDGYKTGDKDFRNQLDKIAKKNPDAVFAPGNGQESALLISQARQLGLKVPFLGGDVWDNADFIQIGKEAVEGASYTFFYDSGAVHTELGQQFKDGYEKKYGKTAEGVSALGFDAYMVLMDAIQRGNSSEPELIQKNLSNTKSFPGASGTISLDQNGDAEKGAVIKKIVGGKAKYMQTVAPY